MSISEEQLQRIENSMWQRDGLLDNRSIRTLTAAVRHLRGDLRAAEDELEETLLALDVPRLRRIEEAVTWVLNDAAFKAPEQIPDVCIRWIDRLTDACKSEPVP